MGRLSVHENETEPGTQCNNRIHFLVQHRECQWPKNTEKPDKATAKVRQTYPSQAHIFLVTCKAKLMYRLMQAANHVNHS